jgi:hypothetical protein
MKKLLHGEWYWISDYREGDIFYPVYIVDDTHLLIDGISYKISEQGGDVTFTLAVMPPNVKAQEELAALAFTEISEELPEVDVWVNVRNKTGLEANGSYSLAYGGCWRICLDDFGAWQYDFTLGYEIAEWRAITKEKYELIDELKNKSNT